MPTSDERCEVAARLRSVTDDELRHVFTEEILNGSVGGRCVDDEGDIDVRLVLNSLADLIDPTCKVVSDETFFGSFGCEEAGTRFMLSCGHETIVEGDYPPSYCSECGARVVSE